MISKQIELINGNKNLKRFEKLCIIDSEFYYLKKRMEFFRAKYRL